MNKFKKGILTFGGLAVAAVPIATSIAAKAPTAEEIAKAEAEFQKKKAEYGKDNVKADTRDYFVFDNAKYPWIDQNKDGILSQADVIFTVKDAMTKEQARLGETTKNPNWATTIAEHGNAKKSDFNLTIKDLVVLKNVSFPKYIHTLGAVWKDGSPLDGFETSIFSGWRIIDGFKIPVNIKTINRGALYYESFIFYKKNYIEIKNEGISIFVGGLEIYKPNKLIDEKIDGDDVFEGTKLALKFIVPVPPKPSNLWKIVGISTSATLGTALLGSAIYLIYKHNNKW